MKGPLASVRCVIQDIKDEATFKPAAEALFQKRLADFGRDWPPRHCLTDKLHAIDEGHGTLPSDMCFRAGFNDISLIHPTSEARPNAPFQIASREIHPTPEMISCPDRVPERISIQRAPDVKEVAWPNMGYRLRPSKPQKRGQNAATTRRGPVPPPSAQKRATRVPKSLPRHARTFHRTAFAAPQPAPHPGSGQKI